MLHLLSGISSFVIYLSIVFLAFGHFNFKNNTVDYKQFSEKQVDLFSDFSTSEAISVASLVPAQELPTPKSQERIALPDVPKRINLNEIFSNIQVTTDAKKELDRKIAQEEMERRQQQEILRKTIEEQKRSIKEQEEHARHIERLSKNATALRENVENLEKITQQTSNTLNSLNEVAISRPVQDSNISQEEYDSWYAKVTNITSRWRDEGDFYKDANIIVRVSVSIDGDFKFLYIVKGSGFSDYDGIAVAFLRKLEMMRFPIPPDNKRKEFNLSFTSKLKRI